MRAVDIRQLRINKGASQRWWAVRLGVSIRTVQRWEKTGYPVTARSMDRLAKCLRTQASSVLGPRGFAMYSDLQRIASTTVNLAVRRQVLPRVSSLTCADCDRRAAEYDHRDYTRPLDVDAVCHRCNARRGLAAHTLLCIPIDAVTWEYEDGAMYRAG